MKNKPKQKFLFQILWLELGLNLMILSLFVSWLKAGNHSLSQNRIPAAAPKVLGIATVPLRGSETPAVQTHFKKVSEPDLSGISAKSFLVFNAEDGFNLMEKKSDQKLGIASLTKLLTAYAVYENLDLSADIQINSSAKTNISPSLGLMPGDTVGLLDLFNAMLVGSENDAAEVLADGLQAKTGESAPNLMNRLAKKIGMENSHFGNPFGFDFGNNYSTANDLKILISFTQSLHAFKNLENMTDYVFSGKLGTKYFAKATNRLVGSHANIFAIKTGYTENALGSIALKTFLEEKPVVVVVIGSQNREKDALRLIEEASGHFKLMP